MSEKILTLPKEKTGFIYPSEITNDFQGTISAWEHNKLIGFIIYNGENDWVFVKGIDYEGWHNTIEEILKKYSQYEFKVNIF